MPSRNADNATWYVLRYPEDFHPRAGVANLPTAPFGLPSSPYHQDTLFHDDARGVLELTPEAPDPSQRGREALPPPGIAVDIDGDVYTSDPACGRILVRRCDGSVAPLVCEPNVFAQPGGLALDRRGYLYVADPAARRVVVVLPDDGSVVAILHHTDEPHGLVDPVDVVVAPSGKIYVADRAGGRICVYTPHFSFAGAFPSQNAAGLPATPRPIAVMFDLATGAAGPDAGDGSILVADANHPRLLRFDPCGAPLADVTLRSLAAEIAGGDVALDALDKAYGTRAPRFLVGACCPLVSNDGGVRLAAVHRALRVLSLALGQRFATQGAFVSAALDSGVPSTTWHKIVAHAALPDGTSIRIETATSDSGTPAPESLDWRGVLDARGAPVTLAPGVPDRLVQSRPGRFLWVRLVLLSDGTATPSLDWLRVYYPRVSYLDLLPPVYQRDPEAGLFLQHFLSLFENVLTGVEDRYEAFTRQLDPQGAPRDVIDWLAALIDLAFDPSWPLDKRRALVAEAVELYALRGTPRGIERFVEIYTGVRPFVEELFLDRPQRPALLGRPGAVLGCGLPLVPAPRGTPDGALWALYAHRFIIHVYADDPCDEAVLRSVVDRIVEINKPTHTHHELALIYPGAQVGVQMRVGIDFVVGAEPAPATRLGGEDTPGAGSTLGVNSVLGERRPGYTRRSEPTLD